MYNELHGRSQKGPQRIFQRENKKFHRNGPTSLFLINSALSKSVVSFASQLATRELGPCAKDVLIRKADIRDKNGNIFFPFDSIHNMHWLHFAPSPQTNKERR